MRPSVVPMSTHSPLPAALALVGLAALGFGVPERAEGQSVQLTADDYARAERFLTANTNPLVYGATVRPQWMDDGRFWYRNTVPGGVEFVMVDPTSAEKGRAFDHERLASAMSEALGTTVEALSLPIGWMTFVGHDVTVEVNGSGLLRCG